MMETSYLLTVVFTNGDRKEIKLDTPHRLEPNPQHPSALTYIDRDGMLHNLPWSGIREFWFSIDEYNACRNANVVQKQ